MALQASQYLSHPGLRITGANPFIASMAALRRLRAQCQIIVAGDDSLNYDEIRPPNTRNLATTLGAPSTANSYAPYGPSIFKAYDIQLDANEVPKITSNDQLPKGHMFPESSECWFRQELIKVSELAAKLDYV
jgi:hypothetical protein